MAKFKPPTECPVCGAGVPLNARACPNCGADECTGWNEEVTRYDGLDLPDSAFDEDDDDDGDDDDGEAKPSRRRKLTRTGVPVLAWITAAVMLLVIVALVIRRMF